MGSGGEGVSPTLAGWRLKDLRAQVPWEEGAQGPGA